MADGFTTTGTDTYTGSGAPSKTYGDNKYLKVATGTTYTFVKLRSPAPVDAVIVSATLRGRARSTGWVASRTVTAKPLSGPFTSKTNHGNKPGVLGTQHAPATVAGLVDMDEISFNVTAWAQAVANGQANHGFRIESTGASSLFYGFDSGVDAWRLDVEWSDSPDQPTSLNPSFGVVSVSKPTLTFDYSDVSGEQDLAAVQVQLSTSSSFASTVYDSGALATALPEVALATLTDTNAVKNPSFETDASSWAGASCSVARTTAQAFAGSASLALTCTTAGTMFAYTDFSPAADSMPVVAEQTYIASVRMRAAATARSCSIRIRWFDAADAEISQANGVAANDSTSAWTLYSVTGVAPAGAVHARIDVIATPAALGEVHYIDDVWFGAGNSRWTGLSDGMTRWWRVRAKDDSAQWSDWSDPVSMTRTVKPTLALDNPSGAVLYDSTPEIIAHITDGTLSAYRVIIAAGNNKSRELYNSGKVPTSGTTISHEVPAKNKAGKTILSGAGPYWLGVQAYDSVANREGSANDLTYSEQWVQFTVNTNGATTVVSTLAVTQVGKTPVVTINWTRASGADKWALLLDGKVVHVWENEDLVIAGSSYTGTWWGANAFDSHTYNVRAVTNGLQSANGPTVTKAVQIEGLWLIRENGDMVVLEGSGVGDWQQLDRRGVYKALNSSVDVDVVSAIEGITGTFKGSLSKQVDQDRAVARTVLRDLKDNPTEVIHLAVGELIFPTRLRSLVVDLPTEEYLPNNRKNRVEFGLSQSGDVPYGIG